MAYIYTNFVRKVASLMTQYKCPECDGFGYIDYEHEDQKGFCWDVELRCPVCDGYPRWDPDDWAEFCEDHPDSGWTLEDLRVPV
jgi:hypothetical protein